jgi:ABC-type spermidine/putrescine transport systems, ATPase components
LTAKQASISPANKRRVGFLFQNYALWPNMTVFQNIAFGLSNIKEAGLSVSPEGEIIRNPEAGGTPRKLTKEEIKRIVARVSAIVKIQPFMDRYPGELSGGQQQRVAIAVRLLPDRRSCLWMNRFPTWTRNCAWK